MATSMFRVFNTIRTTYKRLDGVACVGEEAWIFGNSNTITRIDIHGAEKGTFPTLCLNPPGGISVTSERELIYTDVDSETVNIVRDGKFETLYNPSEKVVPNTLCCIRSGYILVQMYEWKGHQRENTIFRLRGGNIRNVEREPNFWDGEDPLFMSENNNENVCVSDRNANTVVVLDGEGRVRFRYDGTPAMRQKSFRPGGIVTDTMSQIIVMDSNNNCLHILDQNGQFLRCVDDCGLEEPYGLSVDSEGRLWVGSLESGEIKVIEYL